MSLIFGMNICINMLSKVRKDLLNEIIDKYDFDKFLYFRAGGKFVMGLFEYYRRKSKRKIHLVIVVGGIGTKEAAIAYLQNFATIR